MSEVILRADRVCQVFATQTGHLEVLSDLSLTVRRGEVLALVGVSGCGKSTLLKIAAGFIQPTSGVLYFLDQPVRRVEPRCGMVFQDYALFPWKTVQRNVEFGPELNGLPRRKRRERAERFINMVGLKGFERTYPNDLSGGMQQRVALARTLANEPEVLLCDEPFAALDAMTRQIMQGELMRIVQSSGQTVLFVTHSLDEALVLSDRVAIMSARPGRIREIVEVDLERPRKIDVQLSDRYVELKRRLWSAIQEELLKSRAELEAPESKAV